MIFMLDFAWIILRILPMFPNLNKQKRLRSIFVFYTLFVYGLQYSFTAIIVIVGIGFSYLRLAPFVRLGQYLWAKSLFILMGKRVRIVGLENVDKSKKHLLIANHTSIYDIPAIMTIVPRIAWIGRKYLVDIFGFGHLLKMTNYIPIEPGQPKQSRASICRAIEHAKDGLTVAIFPEGTRTIDGKLSAFKKGFIHIMRSADLDVLPITLNGFYSLKPKNRFFIDPRGKLEIVIHPVLKNVDIRDLPDEKVLEIARNAIDKSYQYR